MKTTQLAEEIVTFLNERPTELWTDLTVGTSPTDFVSAENALDPNNSFEHQRRGLYIIPLGSMYERASSQGRSSVVKLNKAPTIIVFLSAPLVELSDDGIDVSSWSYIKKLLNLREEIDEAIAMNGWSINIRSISVEPAQELPLKQRWFASVTEFEFEAFVCAVR